MFYLFFFLLYGFIVGLVAKFLHPGEDPIGFVPTIGIGIVGSYIGGLINWILGTGNSPLSGSGLLMGSVGGFIFCWLYRTYKINKFFQAQGRKPLYKSTKID